MTSPNPNPYPAPVDLSHLPRYTAPTRGRHRSAFLGRVSTKDNQDPASSIPRQVTTASALLDDGEQWVGHWWDVESGMLPPEARGHGDAAMYQALNVPVPRDGGLDDLLDRAHHLGITRVIAERTDRVARIMLTSLTVEHQLGQHGIEVVYANEPQGGTPSGRVRNRLLSQVDAEIIRHTMQEMSMGGQFEHAVSGYNHGRPPYGYVAEIDPDAQVRRNRFGDQRPKRRLALDPDPRRPETVARIFAWRVDERHRVSTILHLLAADPAAHPVGGEWSYNRVLGILANPKYTGHQVYNRKASRTGNHKPNPISEWVWSPRQVHPPIITLDTWVQAQQVTRDLAHRPSSGLEKVQEFAHQRGLELVKIRSSPTHVLYQVGDQRFTVRRGTVPEEIIDRIVTGLEAA